MYILPLLYLVSSHLYYYQLMVAVLHWSSVVGSELHHNLVMVVQYAVDMKAGFHGDKWVGHCIDEYVLSSVKHMCTVD